MSKIHMSKSTVDAATRCVKKYSGLCETAAQISRRAASVERNCLSCVTIAKAINELKRQGKVGLNAHGKLTYIDSISTISSQADATTVSMPTKAQVLESAATSPEAKKALEQLFPQYFEKAKPKLYEFESGTNSFKFIRAFEKALQDLNIHNSTYVAKGVAPNASLEMKTFCFQSNPNVDIVIFNENGKEVARQKGSVGPLTSKLYIGFEKQS